MLKKLAKSQIPAIGDTERTALNCGTVSLDGLIYDGKFTVNDTVTAVLNKEEREFVDVTVQNIVDEHVGNGLEDGLVHSKTIGYMAQTGIFGLNIPKEYGGMGFTPAANSAIMTALSSSGFPSLTVTAMVPNSLGPAELLMHHGTEEERQKYLPALASGEMIPCFALTGPQNGSDATSNMDKGVIDGNKVCVNLNKRYITLAPIADLIGIAVDVEGHGITLFLVERSHPGLQIGMRHDPLGMHFPNGPIRGRVELDLDEHVLGGRENLGRGWQMLVECLSVGRAISLPAMGTGLAEMIIPAVGAYAKARTQFKLPLFKFEAIQEKLADILYHGLINKRMQEVVNGELNKGEQPAILGAMFKYQATERSRKLVDNAMDILGGAGIQQGPNNWIAESFRGVPVGITVEGANIMTRSLITFGQGMVRAHPHVKGIMDGAHGEPGFYKAVGGLLSHATRNGFRAMGGNLNALFAFTADCCLLLGGKLKRSEYVSGRMADFFSNVFIMTILDKEGDVYDYIRKRLRYETKELFYEIVNELPAVVRPKLKLMGKVVFFGAKKVSHKDIRNAVKGYEEVALSCNPVCHTGGRLEKLMNVLRTGNVDDVLEVVQVDDDKKAD